MCYVYCIVLLKNSEVALPFVELFKDPIPTVISFIWCSQSDSNGRPAAYRTTSVFTASISAVRGLEYAFTMTFLF